MLVSPSKRPAPRTPDSRPSKRQATSSPEEGEVDEGTPPPPPRTVLAAGPSSPPRNASKASKVPFPFKKKVAAPEPRLDYLPEAPRPPPAYNRYPDDDRRSREDDVRHLGASRMSRYDDRPMRGGDYWTPGMYDARPARPSWDEPPYDDERAYFPRGGDRWDPRAERAQPLVSPRMRRRSRSPSSPRSRSPLSPDSAGREKHRLPKPSFQDQRNGYDYDREREWERGRDGRDGRDERRRRDSPGPIYEPAYPDKYRDREDDGRHYRRNDSRDSRRTPYDRREPSYDGLRSMDIYHPVSPRTPPRPLSPQSLRDARDGPGTPPMPLEVPPPAPPPDERLKVLPTQHAAVKISLPKKPPTPLDSSSLLAPKEPPKPIRQDSDGGRGDRRDGGETKVVAHRSRRVPVQRTREEERAVYGRIFQGCGMQSDYDVITKLGEGTFGYVIFNSYHCRS